MDVAAGSGGFALADNARLQAEQSRLRNLGEQAEGTTETREGLQKAAREFEAVFLNQLMKAMRSTVPDNKLFNSAGPTKFYQQMYDQELAQTMASGRGGLGVADLIVRQFERNVAASEAAAKGETPTAADRPVPVRDPQGPPAPVHGPPAPIQGPPAPLVTPASVPAAVPAAIPVAEPPASPFGIPVPLPAAAAAARYRVLDETSARTAALARLRHFAGREGTAAADTLSRFEPEIAAAARATDVPPALLLAVVMQESGGDPAAASGKGAKGLMQLMPGTAAEVGVDDAQDPAQNLLGGATYLSRMLERFEGRLDLALAAYNAGPGTVEKAGRTIPDYRETRNYVRNVMDRFGRLGGGMELANGD